VSLAGLLGTQPASSSLERTGGIDRLNALERSGGADRMGGLERTGGLHRTRNVSDDSAGEVLSVLIRGGVSIFADGGGGGGGVRIIN
jgi:hypothetical protein